MTDLWFYSVENSCLRLNLFTEIYRSTHNQFSSNIKVNSKHTDPKWNTAIFIDMANMQQHNMFRCIYNCTLCKFGIHRHGVLKCKSSICKEGHTKLTAASVGQHEDRHAMVSLCTVFNMVNSSDFTVKLFYYCKLIVISMSDYQTGATGWNWVRQLFQSSKQTMAPNFQITYFHEHFYFC